MGEVSEIAVPLLIVFVVSALIVTMPPILVYADTEIGAPQLPEYFSGVSMAKYTSLYNVTIDLDSFSQDPTSGLYFLSFDLGDESYVLVTTGTLAWLKVGRKVFSTVFIFTLFTGYDYMTFANVRGQGRGEAINRTEMDADYGLAVNEEAIQYVGVCQDDPTFRMDVFLGWNQSAYATPADAFLDETMIFLGASGVNQTATMIGGLGLLYSLLLFQPPNVPYPMNYLVSGIIWIPLIVAGVVLASKFLPF